MEVVMQNADRMDGDVRKATFEVLDQLIELVGGMRLIDEVGLGDQDHSWRRGLTLLLLYYKQRILICRRNQ